MRDYYKTLDIKQNSSIEDIKKAYRELSRKYHPENNNGDAFFVNMFNQIQEAYSVLGNYQKRLDYDIEFKEYSAKKITYKSYSKFAPVIEYFQSNKAVFNSGDELRFEWKTLHADLVEIKPFGTVKPYGNNVFKLNDINKQYITVELKATNTKLTKHVSKKLILENKLFKGTKSSFKSEASRTNKQPLSYTTNKTESFLSINGRLRRRDYLIRLVLLNIPFVFFLEVANASNPNENEGLILLLTFIIMVCGIITAIQSIKRLHDINLSGWWYLLFFAPFANIVFVFYLLFKNGTRGGNKFGNDPKNI